MLDPVTLGVLTEQDFERLVGMYVFLLSFLLVHLSRSLLGGLLRWRVEAGGRWGRLGGTRGCAFVSVNTREELAFILPSHSFPAGGCLQTEQAGLSSADSLLSTQTVRCVAACRLAAARRWGSQRFGSVERCAVVLGFFRVQ